MSGPKVIRIITREEIIEICRNYLARLDVAVATWMRIGQRNETIDDSDIQAVNARRDALHRLLVDDRFAELQKQVPVEIDFLKSDTQTRLARAASAAAEKGRIDRRTARTAASLLDALDRARHPVPASLRKQLEQSRKGGPEAETAIAAAFKLLSGVSPSEQPTAQQRELAARLGSGQKRHTLADWIAKYGESEGDKVIERIEHDISEFRAHAGAEAAAPFLSRMAALDKESVASRRALLGDSLLVDLAAATRDQRKKAELTSQLEELNAQLARLQTNSARALCAEIDAILTKLDSAKMPALIEKAAGYLAAEMKARAISGRRLAVLEGLASLGYEVSEGMATAWVKNGRIVLRRAASPDYGIEIGGGADADRLQVRAVGLGTKDVPRDAARDRDMEAIWCSEFERLRALVGKAGGAISVDKALPVGAVPIKIVETYDDREPRTTGAAGPRRRSTPM
jgi:hypothetical protein